MLRETKEGLDLRQCALPARVVLSSTGSAAEPAFRPFSMMETPMRRLIVAAMIAAVPTLAIADPAKVAQARIGYYKLVGLEMDALSAMVKGETPYVAETARKRAANLAALSTYNQDSLVVAGTSNTDLPGKTRSLPDIWKDSAGYAAKEAEFRKAVAALVPAAGEGQKPLAAAFGAVGASCKGCHDTYRAKDF
jgi:cytochrome c556